jgi:hypothetical protein
MRNYEFLGISRVDNNIEDSHDLWSDPNPAFQFLRTLSHINDVITVHSYCTYKNLLDPQLHM